MACQVLGSGQPCRGRHAPASLPGQNAGSTARAPWQVRKAARLPLSSWAHRLKLAVPALALQAALLLDGRQLAGRRPHLQLAVSIRLAALQGRLQRGRGRGVPVLNNRDSRQTGRQQAVRTAGRSLASVGREPAELRTSCAPSPPSLPALKLGSSAAACCRAGSGAPPAAVRAARSSWYSAGAWGRRQHSSVESRTERSRLPRKKSLIGLSP